MCVCVSDRAAGVCVTVLDVFRQARAGFYLHFFNSAIVDSTGRLIVPAVFYPVFGQYRTIWAKNVIYTFMMS